MKDEYLDDLVAKLFAIERTIKFICMTDNKGRLLGVSFRKDVIKRMADEEIEKIARPMVLQLLLAEGMQEFTGSLRYQVGVFERSFSGIIPIKFNPKEILVLIISFDLSVRDPQKVIEDKVLPMIGENKDYFL